MCNYTWKGGFSKIQLQVLDEILPKQFINLQFNFFFHFKKKIKNEDALDMIGRDGPMSKNIFDSANEALKQVFT